MLTEIVIVILLTILNGVLAMSELAVVSSRPKVEDAGGTGQQGRCNGNPSGGTSRAASYPRYKSASRTLVGVLSGAFSGATLGARLTAWLEAQACRPTLPTGWASVRSSSSHHLSLPHRRRACAQADRAARARSGCRESRTGHVLAVALRPASRVAAGRLCKTVLALLGRRASRRKPSPTRRSALYWPRPIMPVSLRLRNPP